MSDCDAAQLVERILETDNVHAFVLVCEAADKYLPMIDSLAIVLANGKVLKVTEISPNVSKKIEETRKTLKREDRIVWALRFYKKALLMECFWLGQHDPEFFKKRFGAVPAPEQPNLQKQIQRLGDIDVSPFEHGDINDPEQTDPPISGYGTIDAINARLGHYIEIADTFGAGEHDNIINRLILSRQSYGDVVSLYRRGEISIKKRYAAVLSIWPIHSHAGRIHKNEEIGYNAAPNADMADSEGPIETIMTFPGSQARWFDLHRNCSYIRDDMWSKKTPGPERVTGHCCNTAGKGACTVYELAERIGPNRWQHLAAFIFYPATGQLGERKGFANQKPPPNTWRFIKELLLQRKEIKGLGGRIGWGSQNDFQITDLPKPWIKELQAARPELFKGTDLEVDEEPPGEEL
jgi:hypothetical protein